MNESWTVVSLAVASAVPLLVVVGWLIVAARLRRWPPGKWFAMFCFGSSALTSARLVQDIGWSMHAPVAVSWVIIAAIPAAITSAVFFFDESFDRHPPAWVIGARLASFGMCLLAVGVTDWVITGNPTVRPVAGGGTFVGVETGPLLLPYHFVLMAWMVGSGVHAAVSADSLTRDRRLLLWGLGISVACWGCDAVAQSMRLGWVRFSDYVSVPVVLAFIYSHAERYGDLYTDMQAAVAKKTESLERANEALAVEFQHREELQQQLAQKERFESLGRLASGVAHDFNNLLTVIEGSSALAREDRTDAAAHAESLEAIDDACARARGLAGQLLAFAKDDPATPESVVIGRRVEQMRRVLEPLVAPNELVLGVAFGEAQAQPVCRIDPSHLDQIVLNLVKNAADASSTGSTAVEIELLHHAQRPDRAPGTVREGASGLIEIRVIDQGVGMEQSTIDHIFEPFFSTKGERGTGLGLATVHGRVLQAGGDIAVVSQPGEGTCFSVWLPVIELEKGSGE